MLTQSGTVMGSPGFMSPEQAEGRAVGPSSDVFSLGAVLTYAAMGEGPFGSGPTPALLYRVVHCEPDTTHLPPEIRPLVERCLAKDPAQRPTTSDLLAELGAAEPVADWLPAPITEVFHRYVPPPPSSPPVAAGSAVPGWVDAEDATVGFPAIPADIPGAAATAADGGPPTATGPRIAWTPTEAAAVPLAAVPLAADAADSARLAESARLAPPADLAEPIGFAGIAALAGAAAAEPGGPGEPAGPGQPAGPGKHAGPAPSGAGRGRPPRYKWGRMAWAALVAVLIAGSAAGGVALRNSLGQQQINTASSTPPPAGSPSSSSSSSGPESPKAVTAPKNNDPVTQAPASAALAPGSTDQAQHSRSATTSPTSPSSPSGGSPPGPATSAVPNVVGSTLSAATSALKARGFSNISSVTGCYGGTAGDVVKQNPAAGVRAALTAAIQLSVQSSCYTVPNVVGMTQADATSALQAAGFTDIYAEDGCYGGTAGDVVSQEPAAGTSYAGNQQVTLDVQADSCATPSP
jgi:eukaryotic-like serine/threonine-protein kinase